MAGAVKKPAITVVILALSAISALIPRTIAETKEPAKSTTTTKQNQPRESKLQQAPTPPARGMILHPIVASLTNIAHLSISPNKTVADSEITVGVPNVIEGMSPTPPFDVIFEDDGNSGYFYALDTSSKSNGILDALHIYTVASVTDKTQPSKVQIVWSKDGKKAALLINKYPHAIFDFQAARSYCRTGFPPPSRKIWPQPSHNWDDKALDLFH